MSQTERQAFVLTPTIGTPLLRDAIKSVQNQTYNNLLHVIVIDGEEFKKRTYHILDEFDNANYKVICLPFNTGQGIFNGHRIYAALSFLIDSDYVFFLDEDNWYDKDHVRSLVNIIESNDLDWAYSLRKIYSHNSEFLVNDDCESLGRWSPYSGNLNLVDTNCYAIKRSVLTKIGHTWYHPKGADRVFYKIISSNFKNFKTTFLYSLNYRLNATRPPFGNFFIKGNAFMLKKYSSNLPWKQGI